jgi:hypothetical protein
MERDATESGGGSGNGVVGGGFDCSNVFVKNLRCGSDRFGVGTHTESHDLLCQFGSQFHICMISLFL